jgi:DDE superfamily endonuclease
MAETVLLPTLGRLGRRATRRAHSPLFPPASSLRSNASRAKAHAPRGCHSRAGRCASCSARLSRAAWWATISGTTVWRWLAADAICPWRHRSWLFPRDPDFATKAGPILDLYAGVWQDEALTPDDCVLSADEKTSIQARRRRHAPEPCGPTRIAKIEHEYERMGAWAYLAAWDVQRAKLFSRCEPANGIAPFDRLVAQVMAEEPYRSARRVFWIVDNGSGHRAPQAVERLQRQWPNVIPVFTPVHASWLNQIEIYFSVVQRKVLTPGDFADLAALEAALLGFQHRYEAAARPFEWTFTRQHLTALLTRLALAGQRPAA